MFVHCLTLIWALVVTVVCQLNPESQLPDDYIVEVDQVCGEVGNKTSLTVTSDLTISVKVLCKGDNLFTFTTEDDVVHTFPVYFTGNITEKCIYKKKDSVSVYKVTVIVNVVEEDEGISSINREARYTMTCTYGDKGDKRSSNTSIQEQYYSAREIQSMNGNLTTEQVSVFITDVLGRPIKGDNVPMDKFLRLKVHFRNLTGWAETRRNISIFPVSCEAIGNSTGHHYALIRSGCGDGVIFKKTQGFTMMPGVAISSYFKFFHMTSDKSFRVSCNFTLCSNCIHKNSCSGGSKKGIFHFFKEWIEAGNSLGKRPPGSGGAAGSGGGGSPGSGGPGGPGGPGGSGGVRSRRNTQLNVVGPHIGVEEDFRFSQLDCPDCYPEPVLD